ncbi:hypothetical protein BGZ92_006216 [Podila epicladia]|nr:hypothetical protein BGZ92_006216 [Podila epicladia]
MSGGAIAGLVVGVLVILIGSVFGGMILLKKRRKRMMLSGRGSSYNNESYPSKREAVEDSSQGPKGFGDKVSRLWAGTMAKKSKTDEAQRTVPDPYSNYNNRYQSRLSTPFDSGNQASSPGLVSGGVPLPRMIQRTSSPVPSSLGGSVAAYPYPTHQSGALPPVSPPYQSPPGQYFPPPHPPPVSVPGSTIHPGPGNQHYVYQPGTGLVSVPLSLPHSAPPPQLPHIPQPYQQPISLVHPMQASFVAPPSLVQQPYQQHHQQQVYQQQQQQLHQHQQQQYQQFQQPPQLQTTIPRTQPVVSFPPPVTTNATPVSSSIFLPGDSSRPLLGQGLFKIVPDAEDVEEEKLHAEAARQGTNSSTLQSVELNLGGDFLSSVINYENQEQRFESLENQANSGANSRNNSAPISREITVPTVDGPAGEIQEYTRSTAYHDRSAGNQRQSTQRDQGAGDKQELDDDEEPSTSSPVVIVGSDIVFEPLPSVKAAAAAAAAAAAVGASADSNPSSPPPPASKSNVSDPNAVSSPSSPTSTLTRMATIGKVLPTMGTEEYLERTDDKEEYSFGLHGDRRDIVGSPSASPTSATVPPPIVRSTKPKPIST